MIEMTKKKEGNNLLHDFNLYKVYNMITGKVTIQLFLYFKIIEDHFITIFFALLSGSDFICK